MLCSEQELISLDIGFVGWALCPNCDDMVPFGWELLHVIAERQNWPGWWFSTPNFTCTNPVPYGWEVEHEEAEEATQWTE